MESWALVTGGAKRIGRVIARKLHSNGYKVLIHYSNSHSEAQSLCNEFNRLRENSSVIVQAELSNELGIMQLAQRAADYPLAVLVNNASAFYPMPLEAANFNDCQRLLSINLLAPYLLAQQLATSLSKHQGTIINLLDIHGTKPLKDHGLYSISKAALQMATLSLAQELGPEIRVNGVAPGAIIWPENSKNGAQDSIIKQIPLARCGAPSDIADTVQFLVDSHYISGQIIAVDGGRTVTGYLGA
ncbi:pteridine reductase [Shewanella eurypsychrophilus]|uniref:Pteridine reductase n=1 Tax=Shewanella eurypsychrophilus TaxID=2593656 RepID=A0ABX6V5X6_9GAMM|nr:MULTISPECIES: pteridine reductase [Shewanella]QFU22751.1 pteridine reductase [Shewanella sp. YLB-09]QPG58040.1 pteridine reductase [Shewanella eurypsychrophilus]